MITIKKVGRFGVFENVIDSKLEQVLFDKLSYTRQGAQFMPNPQWGVVRFYNKRKRCFPWGLLSIVEDILEQWEKYSREEYSIMRDTTVLKLDEYYKNNSQLREYQKQAIERLLENHGGILSIPTGGGKTLTTICYLQSRIYDKALILVPTRDLVYQWQKELGMFMRLKTCVYTYQYMMRHKEKLNEFDVVVMDECHHVPSKQIYQIAMSCSSATMIGLSATPFRADGEDMKIRAALGDIVYKITIEDLQKQGYLTHVKILISPIDKIKLEPWDDYIDVVDKCIIHNSNRILSICNLVNYHASKPCLILVDKIEHGTILNNAIKDSIFIHGQSVNRKQLLQDVFDEKHQVVIATKIYGEGVNIPCLKSLILAGGGKSCVKILQEIGRILRLFKDKSTAYIYDFANEEKYLKEHFKERLKIYETNKFETVWL
jgi:superfamily II DNA or RNA helicase